MISETNTLSNSDIDDVIAINRLAKSCNLVEELETRLLPEIARSFGLSVCHLSLNPSRKDDLPYRVAFHGINQNYQNIYRKRFSKKNPFTSWIQNRDGNWPGLVPTEAEILKSRSYRRSEYYKEYHRPLNMHQTMSIMLKFDHHATARVGLWRSDRGKAFDTQDKLKAELIAPSLSSAFHRANKKQYMSDFKWLLETVGPENIVNGIALLNENFEIVFSNVAARNLIHAFYKHRDGIKTNMDNPKLPAALEDLCSSALNREGRVGISHTMQPYRKANLVKIDIIPMPKDLTTCYLLRLVPDASMMNKANVLQDIGLSPREIDVVNAITLGLKNREAADRLCISSFTVQDHLKSIYKKLDVNNRTGLIHYLHQYLH